MNERSGEKSSAKFRVKGSTNDTRTILVSSIRRALSSYFGAGRRIILVEVTRVEEDKAYGFLKVRSEKKRETFLLDFKANSTLRGTLSSLEVDGKKIAVR